MIQKFVNTFISKEAKIRQELLETNFEDYKELVKKTIEYITDKEYNSIDPDRIHEINDGDYQGTLLYIIAAKGYQPSDYWSVKVGYGSCSGCDTLQSIDVDAENNKDKADQYYTLMLHVVQQLKEVQ